MATIYLGSIYPPTMIEELRSLNSSIDFAAETFQVTLLKGLIAYLPQIRIITAPNVSSYPKIRKPIFSRRQFVISPSEQTHFFTGFVNLPIIKHLSKSLRVFFNLKRLMDANDENTLLIYGVHSPFLLPLLAICHKKLKTCLIVPDLPEFMSNNKSKSYLFAKKIDRYFINLALSKVDSYILFSPYMKERLPVKDSPCLHIEGIIDKESVLIGEWPKEKEKVILYTGNLSERMGILELLEAFSLIPYDNYRLWIRGNGECKQRVIAASVKDSRIVYFPPMDKKELLILQKKATILINPVPSSKVFTRFFFPSKTMEYMASGTPTVMSHLQCIPMEYDSHIYYFEDESIHGIRNKIIEVCEKSQEELERFGKEASEFILNEKNEIVQASKIVEFIKS